MLFDTHAHLDDEQLFPQVASLVADAKQHQVTSILTVATSLASSYRSLQLAESYTGVYAAVGIHPNYCHQATPVQFQEVAQLIEHPRVVAIGETGLDDHWDFCPLELQKEFFLQHIALSHSSGLPFIVHMRDCEPLMMKTLEMARNDSGMLNGVMHSFCGSRQAAQQCLEWGMYISFAGMVTYRKNTELREIAADIPAERLLIETNAPYLSPHPCRNQRPNTPALMRHTLQCLAETRGVAFDQLARTTSMNAMRLFGKVRPVDVAATTQADHA